ncbi:MAG TPA: hypothetical protein VK191_14110 [Symbiobacteriaceae bacterium]|nr:hypothetical protein [Symbiobacteriaceae bacterium]
MPTLLGCALPEATLAIWSRLLVTDTEPFYLIEGDYHMLPADHGAVPRSEFALPGADEGLRDSYRLWNVDRKATWAWAIPAERWHRLSFRFQNRLNVRQWELGRGNIYDSDWVLERIEPYTEVICIGSAEIETPEGLKVLLRAQYWWDVLPERGRWAWLSQIVQDEALADCQSGRLDALDWQRLEGRFPAIQALAGSFVERSGPNCFAAALAPLVDPALAEETASRWLTEAELNGALTDLGYRSERVLGEVQGRDLAPGTVVGWADSSGSLQHAFTYLGEGLVLNKQSQCWWHPRQIVPFRVAWDNWTADGLAPILFQK